jgi:hypothetical protein
MISAPVSVLHVTAKVERSMTEMGQRLPILDVRDEPLCALLQKSLRSFAH